MIGKDDSLKMLDKVLSLGKGFDICAHLVQRTLALLDMQEIRSIKTSDERITR